MDDLYNALLKQQELLMLGVESTLTPTPLNLDDTLHNLKRELEMEPFEDE